LNFLDDDDDDDDGVDLGTYYREYKSFSHRECRLL